MTNLAGMCSNMSAEENYQKTVWLNKAGELSENPERAPAGFQNN